MAYETKVLIISMAQYAIAIRCKPMYDYLAPLADFENIKLPPYPAD